MKDVNTFPSFRNKGGSCRCRYVAVKGELRFKHYGVGEEGANMPVNLNNFSLSPAGKDTKWKVYSSPSYSLVLAYSLQ